MRSAGTAACHPGVCDTAGMGALLVACGIVAALLAGWASYGNARAALAVYLHEGDPTRAAIEAARPIAARSRVRAFARHVTLVVGWLVVTLYGLWLAAEGAVAR